MEHVIYKHRSIDVVSRVFDWVGFISVVHIHGKLIDQYSQGLTMYGTAEDAEQAGLAFAMAQVDAVADV